VPEKEAKAAEYARTLNASRVRLQNFSCAPLVEHFERYVSGSLSSWDLFARRGPNSARFPVTQNESWWFVSFNGWPWRTAVLRQVKIIPGNQFDSNGKTFTSTRRFRLLCSALLGSVAPARGLSQPLPITLNLLGSNLYLSIIARRTASARS